VVPGKLAAQKESDYAHFCCQQSPLLRYRGARFALLVGAGMHAALRDALTGARINGISPGSGEDREPTARMMTSEARAA
jgi:hypothetical protein